MSQLYDGWDLFSLLDCLVERIGGVQELCNVVLDDDGASDDACSLAASVLRELDGGEA